MAGRGQPTKYSDELAFKVIAVATSSPDLSNEEIADLCGISRSSFYEYRSRFPDFANALKLCKDVADGAIVATLWRRANGYSRPAVKIIYDQKRGEFKTHTYIEHVPPDSAALHLWLSKRMREEWGDEGGNTNASPILMAYDRTQRIPEKSQTTIDVKPIKNTGAVTDGQGKEE